MTDKKVGLTLGKFAPLGHQYMIEKAIEEMDEVIVVIYDCPETTNVPLPVRSNWIKSLYPSVEVIEAWDGPTETGDTPEIKKKIIFLANWVAGKSRISIQVSFMATI